MAQSGYTPILIYGSGTATNVPLAADLTSSANGAELALNYADGKLYYKNSSGVVTLLADKISVSVASANGFAGSVSQATATSTPAITLSTSVNGIIYGNGTSMQAVTIGSGVSFAGGTLSATGTGGTVTAVSVASANGFAGSSSGGATPALTLSTTISGVLKGNGTAISAAVSGTDYAPATSGTSILYGNGAGGFSNVTIGTGISFAAGTLSATGTGGTVTAVSVASANGFAGTSSGGATPALTLSTSITGILKGDGTAISAAVSGTDLKTVNSNSLLGSGNISVGTVTSVAATNGTGISISGSPITSSGTLTITNTGVTSVTAGTGISVSASTGGVTITNTASGGTTMLFSPFSFPLL